MRRSPRLVPAVLALSAVAVLASCTGDDPEPGPSGSATSGSATPTPSFTDQSALVLGAQLPAVVGSTKGEIRRTPATLNVAGVEATRGGTVLTFWHTGTDKLLVDAGDLSWEAQPVLVDPAAKKVYEPVTFVDDRGETRCLCTDAAYIRGIPQPRTVYYPDLPETVTTVEVRQAGFEDTVPVPVTR